jgi:hypothetical protein
MAGLAKRFVAHFQAGTRPRLREAIAFLRKDGLFREALTKDRYEVTRWLLESAVMRAVDAATTSRSLGGRLGRLARFRHHGIGMVSRPAGLGITRTLLQNRGKTVRRDALAGSSQISTKSRAAADSARNSKSDSRTSAAQGAPSEVLRRRMSVRALSSAWIFSPDRSGACSGRFF